MLIQPQNGGVPMPKTVTMPGLLNWDGSQRASSGGLLSDYNPANAQALEDTARQIAAQRAMDEYLAQQAALKKKTSK